MPFYKPVKSKAKLRCALFGVSGSGKTYSALSIASGMGGKIAVIDTEYGAASKYIDHFDFDTQDLVVKTIDEYIRAIKEAEDAGYSIIIIDSLSHAWQELLEEVDKIASAKYHGNSWSAWSEGTPKQKALINAILGSKCHIFATMRSKTEWQTSADDRGKTKVVRVGLAPEQGKGIEYEFDMLMEISQEHIAHVIKDRTGKFQDAIIEKPGPSFGKQLIDWLNTGVDAPQKQLVLPPAAEEVVGILEAYKSQLNPAVVEFAEKALKESHPNEWFERLAHKMRGLLEEQGVVNG